MKTFTIAYEDFASLEKRAGEILELAKPVKKITLQGDLGAGKTTLIKAFCKALGIKFPVSSPTFTLINEYAMPNGEPVYHIDMYRIEKPEEAMQLGLEEYFEQDAWCFIEWPEKITGWLPENFVSLKIEVDAMNNSRNIFIRLAD
ncbi:MAG: tRNA (adenosine(37)-N6)-threonylcarbamoyltransferase complex ATPase subunit type 1 TsaE [Bacteroidales bacterium]